MSLVEHLYELRRRLLISLASIAVMMVVTLIWYSWAPWHIPTIGEMLLRPYCSVPSKYRANLSGDGQCRLLATSVTDQIMLRIKVSMAVAVVLSCPIWLYQLWKFIVPGLHKNEKRYATFFVLTGSALFVSGALLAYFVVAKAFEFLLRIGANVQDNALVGSNYFSFMVHVLVIFGVSFEVPLLILALNFLGVLTYERLKQWSRGIIFGLFVFAAIAAPGQDPFTMLAMAFALVGLFGIAMIIARIHDQRKRRSNPNDPANFRGLSDEEASPLPPTAGTGAAPTSSCHLDAPAPVRTPSPVTSSSQETSPEAYDDIL